MKLHLPKRRFFRVLIYFFSIALILLAIDLLLVRMGRHITVATDTTFITSPLKPDGSPDYLRYVAEQYSQGITAENNAAPLLVATFDPALFPEPVKDQVYGLMGVSAPRSGESLIYYVTFLKAKGIALTEQVDRADELDKACTHFWKAADNPLLAEHLRSQMHMREVFHQAAQRPRYYVPLFNPKSDLMISQFIPALNGTRLAAKVMLAQAMLDASEGNYDQAHAEILDVHRMANLLAQQTSVIEVVLAIRLGDMACDADAVLAAANLSALQAKNYLADLSALPPMPTCEHAIDKGERLFGLDSFVFASHIGMPEALTILSDPETSETGNTFVYHFIPVNMNAAMRKTNACYDEILAALRLPTYAQRVAALKACDDHVVAYANKASWDPTRRLLGLILPSLVNAGKRDDIQRMHLDLVRVAYALAAYHAERGGYPQTLADIAAVLPQVPLDRFTDQPLHYQKTDSGYLLYSVGPNMIDDGGKHSPYQYTGDYFNKLAGNLAGTDDIAITVPPPKSN